MNTDSKLFQLPYPIPVFCLLLQVTNFPSAGPLCGLRGLNITPKFPPFVSRPSTTSHLIRLSLPAGLKVTKRSFTFLTLSSKYFQSLAALLPEHSLYEISSPSPLPCYNSLVCNNTTRKEEAIPNRKFLAVFLEEREK